MTVNYHKQIMVSRPWTFINLLWCWKGSIWKAVYLEVIIYIALYAAISLIYRLALSDERQKTFEAVVRYFDARLSYIPLELVLGFFCTQIIGRWTKLYQTIGFIDNVGLMAALYLRGTCERARRYRRSLLRYCELIQVLIFRDMSMRTRRRFPTLDTVVAAGFMLPHEKKIYEEYGDNTPKYWVPANWALDITYKAWKHGHIESDYYKVALQNQIKTWRTDLEWVSNYDWVPLPLIYPQVVCLAVHLYFLVSILSRQYVVSDHEQINEIDAYFPFMTVIQFAFYMGWMKVIEALLNPFGEDDDDFETNALIDRNITMGLMIVDQGYNKPPELRKDPFWEEEVHPLYSEETSKTRNLPHRGSVSHVKLPSRVREVVMVPHERDDKDEPLLQPDRPIPKRNTVRVKDEDRYVQSTPSSSDSIIEKIKNYFLGLWRRVAAVCLCRRGIFSTRRTSSKSSKSPFVRATPPPTVVFSEKECSSFNEKEVI